MVVGEVDATEAMKIFDENARYCLGISGVEFLRRWNAGEYPHPDTDRNVMLVASLLPLVWLRSA